MGVQTSKTDFSYSDGLSFEISTDSGSTWLDVGVMEDGASFTFNYDKSELESGNAENPDPLAKNLTLAMAPSPLWTWDTEAIEALGAGLFTRTVVAAAEVTGASQAVASGNWAYETGILIKNQMGDGTAPTINSVTGSIDSTLTLGTDYYLVNGSGGWSIVVTDSVDVTTEAQTITIGYDYTPAASTVLTAGTTSKVLLPFQCRFTHWTNDVLTTYDYRLTAYRVSPDSGGLVFNKLGAKSSNDLDTWTIAMTAELDSGLADGSQLFRIEQSA